MTDAEYAERLLEQQRLRAAFEAEHPREEDPEAQYYKEESADITSEYDKEETSDADYFKEEEADKKPEYLKEESPGNQAKRIKLEDGGKIKLEGA